MFYLEWLFHPKTTTLAAHFFLLLFIYLSLPESGNPSTVFCFVVWKTHFLTLSGLLQFCWETSHYSWESFSTATINHVSKKTCQFFLNIRKQSLFQKHLLFSVFCQQASIYLVSYFSCSWAPHCLTSPRWVSQFLSSLPCRVKGCGSSSVAKGRLPQPTRICGFKTILSLLKFCSKTFVTLIQKHLQPNCFFASTLASGVSTSFFSPFFFGVLFGVFLALALNDI